MPKVAGSTPASHLHQNQGNKITKQEFKICEAVVLGLTHYYMGLHDKREVTATEHAEALATIPDLPKGWMQAHHEWDACKR